MEKENICSPDPKERLHQAHQAVESDDRVQTNGSWKRSSLAEDYLPRFQVTCRCSLLRDQLFFFTFAGSLTSTRTDSSTRESFVGWPLLQWSVHKSYKPSFRFWILYSGSDVFKQYILKKKVCISFPLSNSKYFFQRCDKDKNGKLDFQEFQEMITR